MINYFISRWPTRGAHGILLVLSCGGSFVTINWRFTTPSNDCLSKFSHSNAFINILKLYYFGPNIGVFSSIKPRHQPEYVRMGTMLVFLQEVAWFTVANLWHYIDLQVHYHGGKLGAVARLMRIFLVCGRSQVQSSRPATFFHGD